MERKHLLTWQPKLLRMEIIPKKLQIKFQTNSLRKMIKALSRMYYYWPIISLVSSRLTQMILPTILGKEILRKME